LKGLAAADFETFEETLAAVVLRIEDAAGVGAVEAVVVAGFDDGDFIDDVVLDVLPEPTDGEHACGRR